jgi:3D-(3,5/4)-trihydroxycyclohexane-1,2-dione acylhydrolase (decyclizing)
VHYAEATEALAQWAEATGIPVGVTQAGKGAMLDGHSCCVGAIGATGSAAAARLAEEADLVLLVGTRLSDFTTASKTLFQDPAVRFVSVQIHPFDAHKHGALPLVGDARSILEDLRVALGDYRVSPSYAAAVAAARTAWERQHQALVHPQVAGVDSSPSRAGAEDHSPGGNGGPVTRLHQSEVIRIVNEHVGPASTVVHAAGGLPGDLHKLWRSQHPDDYHAEYGYSCMGYEIAGALGVKLAQPEREVIALLGDGSYLMLHTELLTSLQEGLPITVVLVDNGGYQCIHDLQRSCGGRSFGNEFRRRDERRQRLEGERLEIDFVQNARSFGAEAVRAETSDELKAALEAARASSRSMLIHVPVEPSPLPGFAWWDVPMSEVSAVDTVQEERRRYEAARRKRVFYY